MNDEYPINEKEREQKEMERMWREQEENNHD